MFLHVKCSSLYLKNRKREIEILNEREKGRQTEKEKREMLIDRHYNPKYGFLHDLSINQLSYIRPIYLMLT